MVRVLLFFKNWHFLKGSEIIFQLEETRSNSKYLFRHHNSHSLYSIFAKELELYNCGS